MQLPERAQTFPLRIGLNSFLLAHADLERVFGVDGYEPLPDEDLEYCMTLSDTMGPYKPSTMLDLINRRSMEVKVCTDGRIPKRNNRISHLLFIDSNQMR